MSAPGNCLGSPHRHTRWISCAFLTALFAVGAASAQIDISSVEDLQKIGNDDLYPVDAAYELIQDIDASGTSDWNGGLGFKPIW